MIRPALFAAAMSAGAVSIEPPVEGMEFESHGRNCIALTVFTEARGEPVEGQMAVVEVIRRRMALDAWPDDPCRVVEQMSQFHGFRDWPRPGYPWDVDAEAWELALRVTDGVMLEGWQSGCAPAEYFYSGDAPSWASRLQQACRIGGHTFLAGAE